MRLALLVLSFAFVLGSSPCLNSQQSTAPPQRDLHAMEILAQSVSSMGGAQSVSSVRDFTATGTITYFSGEKEVTGPMIIKSRGMGDFRLETQFPNGVRSITVRDGRGTLIETDGQRTSIPYHNAIKAAIPVLPQIIVVTALADETSSVEFAGTMDQSSHRAHRMLIHPKSRVRGAEEVISKLMEKSIFIDADNGRITKVSDKTHPVDSFLRELDRDFEFEAYVSMNGQVVPTVIREKIGGSPISEFHIRSISFNTGLTDKDFPTE